MNKIKIEITITTGENFTYADLIREVEQLPKTKRTIYTKILNVLKDELNENDNIYFLSSGAFMKGIKSTTFGHMFVTDDKAILVAPGALGFKLKAYVHNFNEYSNIDYDDILINRIDLTRKGSGKIDKITYIPNSDFMGIYEYMKSKIN